VLADVVAVREGPTPERKVSWIPGAEGAPIDWGWRWEWVLVWPDGGAILIAWRIKLVEVIITIVLLVAQIVSVLNLTMMFDVEGKGRVMVEYCFRESLG